MTRPDPYSQPSPAYPSRAEPCPAQLQPSPNQTRSLNPPPVSLSEGSTPSPTPSRPSSQSKQVSPPRAPGVPRPRPHQESKSPGSSGRGLWGRREAGAANAEGSELSPRKLKTRPTADTHLNSHTEQILQTCISQYTHPNSARKSTSKERAQTHTKWILHTCLRDSRLSFFRINPQVRPGIKHNDTLK